MSAEPVVTAVVCTYNRCRSLRDTLNSLRGQSLPAGQRMEIVVVDNNSNDQTRQVAEEAAAGSPWPIHCVLEKNQGIAHARNRGLRTGRGRYVAFIDDDAVAEADWAAQIARCFEETSSDMVGGKVAALWLAPRPNWLSSDLMGPIPRVDFGPIRRRCTKLNETFLTTNCALRRSSLEKYGLFDTTLGRRRDRWVGGEDLELCQRWIQAGARATYEPAAVVHHKVGPERVTPAFYRRWFQDIGYTQGHQLSWKWHLGLTIIPVWRWKAFFQAWVGHLQTLGSPAPSERKLQAELWWLFHRSFLKERFWHWQARLAGIRNPICQFARAV